MTQFFSISTFRKRLTDLLSVKRGVYSNVRKEIVKEFTGKSIEEIRQNRDMILLQDDITVVKLRIPDKKMRLSRKDGYRLIYLVSREVEVVTFLDIYPKNGPSQQLDLSENNLKELLLEFIQEFELGLLLYENLE
ncbi:MAG: hypothetical protein K2J63_03670 [Muribaculaceae bacterium]|nr:hypothetical protein [Muribaculaceae bacterium]MDE6794383.1 hypothetical protein [Muribaculaceae bacterium]